MNFKNLFCSWMFLQKSLSEISSSESKKLVFFFQIFFHFFHEGTFNISPAQVKVTFFLNLKSLYLKSTTLDWQPMCKKTSIIYCVMSAWMCMSVHVWYDACMCVRERERIREISLENPHIKKRDKIIFCTKNLSYFAKVTFCC